MIMSNIDVVLNYFDELFLNPKCELNYSKDYELLIAVMLSAQTTDKRVNKVTKILFDRYPDLKSLKEADIEDIKKIVRELGSYTKKASAVIEIARILDEKYGGIVPMDRTSLESLPMVGRKTCNVVLSEYFSIPNIAVDTHVDRVSKRLGFAKENDNVLVVEKKLKRLIPKDCWNKAHLQFVLFGRYHCMAKKPLCDNCKLSNICKMKKH